jgi:ABC-type branched-subunit amino acid transport system substrate-binding protein
MALVAAGVALAAGCGTGAGSNPASAPLTVYLSVPLSGAQAAQGKGIAAGAKAELARVAGKAGGHPIVLKVLDDTGGGARWSPVATAANARTASEDAAAIAFIGDLDPGATGTSLPITDLAKIPQLVLSAVPSSVDVGNQIDPARYSNAEQQGKSAMGLLLIAIEGLGEKATDRVAVRDELRKPHG